MKEKGRNPTRKDNMRNYNSIFEVRNAFTGIIVGSHTVAGTMLGNAVDTINFQDLLAVLTIGALCGSGATDRACDVAVKLQECATSNGTFTDITAGALQGTASVLGSARFDTVQVVAGSGTPDDPFYQRKLYYQINQGNQKRYIRPHATITGSSGSMIEAAMSVAILLGRPRESAYIADPVSATTTDAFVTWGVASASIPAV